MLHRWKKETENCVLSKTRWGKNRFRHLSLIQERAIKKQREPNQQRFTYLEITHRSCREDPPSQRRKHHLPPDWVLRTLRMNPTSSKNTYLSSQMIQCKTRTVSTRCNSLCKDTWAISTTQLKRCTILLMASQHNINQDTVLVICLALLLILDIPFKEITLKPLMQKESKMQLAQI